MSVEGDDRARRGGRAVDPNREQPLLDQAAVFGARRQLLADIAALVPIDPVQFVEPGFEQDRLVQREVAAAVGNTEREAQAVVLGEIGLGRAGRAQYLANPLARQNRPRAERRQTRVGKCDSLRRARLPRRDLAGSPSAAPPKIAATARSGRSSSVTLARSR